MGRNSREEGERGLVILLLAEQRKGWEPDDLLCLRNARPQKDGKGAARCPSCSQNAHGETVLVRCAQSRAASATPSKEMWRK